MFRGKVTVAEQNIESHAYLEHHCLRAVALSRLYPHITPEEVAKAVADEVVYFTSGAASAEHALTGEKEFYDPED